MATIRSDAEVIGAATVLIPNDANKPVAGDLLVMVAEVFNTGQLGAPTAPVGWDTDLSEGFTDCWILKCSKVADGTEGGTSVGPATNFTGGSRALWVGWSNPGSGRQWSATAASRRDGQNTNSDDTNSVNTRTVGSVTPTTTESLAIAVCATAGGTDSPSVDSSYVLNASTGFHPGVGYLEAPSTTAKNPAFTWTGTARRPATGHTVYKTESTGANTAPTASAGLDQSRTEGETVTLHGSVTVEGEGTGGPPYTYTWVQLSGTTVTLSSTTVLEPTFSAPAPATSPEDLVFGFTVTGNGALASTQDTVTITVSPAPESLPFKVRWETSPGVWAWV